MLTRRQLSLSSSLAGLSLLTGERVSAQPLPWPDRPVRVVVPFGPGGAIDILARIMAPHFPAVAQGQSMVVENRGGAGGTIGAGLVAQARPDGHTLLMAEQASAALAHELYRDLPYDPRRSFTPVIFLAALPMILVVRQNLPASDLAGLLNLARQRPDSLSYGTVGAGHIGHLSTELLLRSAGARMLHVIYRSGADMVTAVAKGEIDATITSLSSSIGFLQSGAVRPLAVSTPRPLVALPGVPPMAATVPGATPSLWYGLVGPAAMQPELVNRINAVFNTILAIPEVREALHKQQAAEVIGGPPERFAEHIASEIDRWTPVLRAAGVRAG